MGPKHNSLKKFLLPLGFELSKEGGGYSQEGSGTRARAGARGGHSAPRAKGLAMAHMLYPTLPYPTLPDPTLPYHARRDKPWHTCTLAYEFQ